MRSPGYDFGALAQANLSVPARLAYTYTKATFQSAFESTFEPWGTVAEGDALPYVPTHQFSFGLGLQTLHFGLELSGKYVGRMRTTAGQSAYVDHQSIDAHFVLDLAADYSLTRQVKLFASVRNLTDEAYIVARRPAGIRPGLPRLFLLGVKADF